ncbi:MAG TPA: hypothetical protein VFI42_04590, partial [Thermomicrobiaceae bacterium]|nr:hypothetical protein [Thermomicrobiaceae bacterium]
SRVSRGTTMHTAVNSRQPRAGAISRRQLVRRGGLVGAGALGLALVQPAAAAQPDAAASAGLRDRRFLALHDTMRKLWEDHITWTRLFIVSFAAGLPDLDATTQRLLQNQVDLGDAFKPAFGDAAGTQLTQLLTDHILGAAKLLSAAKAGDADGVEAAKTAWYDNGNQIAAFLHSLNRRAWPLEDMQMMMQDHLDLTLAEGVARLNGDFAADIAAYEQVHQEILMMADMLTAGFPAGRRP